MTSTTDLRSASLETDAAFEDEEYARLLRRCRGSAGFLVAVGTLLLVVSDATNRLALARAGLVIHVVVHSLLVLSGAALWLLVPADGALPRTRRVLVVGWVLGTLAALDAAHVVMLAARGATVIYVAATMGAAVLRLPGRKAALVYAAQAIVLGASLLLVGGRAQLPDVMLAVLATVAALLLQGFQLRTARRDFDQRRTIAEQNARLVRLDKEKNEFLGIAAHDLKNPLNAIRGYTQMLIEDDPAEGEPRATHEKVLQASERMFQLVCNLLDVNAIERGEVKLVLTDVAFDQLVERALEPHRAGAAAKGQAMVVEVAEHAVVRADASLAHQVIDNLVSNAVKYSPPGKRITVRVRAGAAAARFEVQDEGPGLTAEDQAKLFGTFARLSAKPTGGEHSTGLGLSIVKKLVESMDGRVWCESAPGLGATFLLELPVAKAAPPSPIQPSH